MMKYVASTVVVGPRGDYQVTRGYTEISGVRFYEDQVVIGQHGEPVLSKGTIEIASKARTQWEGL